MRLSSQSNPEFAPEAFLPPVADRHEIQSAAELPLLPLGHLALGLPKPLNYIDHPAYEGGYDEADPDEGPASPIDVTKLQDRSSSTPNIVLNVSSPYLGLTVVSAPDILRVLR